MSLNSSLPRRLSGRLWVVDPVGGVRNEQLDRRGLLPAETKTAKRCSVALCPRSPWGFSWLTS